MNITIPHDAGISLDILAERVNDIESRIGRIVDLQALEIEDGGVMVKKTYSAHELWVQPAGSTVFVIEGGAAPEGGELIMAGTAYIDSVEVKAVVKAYRMPDFGD